MKIFKVYHSIEDDSRDEVWVKMTTKELVDLEVSLNSARWGLNTPKIREQAGVLEQKIQEANNSKKIRWSIE